MKTLLLATALSLGLAACADQAEPTDTATPTHNGSDARDRGANATVERIIDGDTLIADINGRSERVRLLGIDTPESVARNRPDQCYGKESSLYLESLLPEGTPITLTLDQEARDQYDRLLAYVVRSDDQLFVNLDLLLQGYAGVLIYSPNDFYADLFRDAEQIAISDGAGLWTVCGGPDVPLD